MNYNKTLPQNGVGYVVAGRAFASLRAAEVYCDDKGYDVSIIKLDVPAAKEIARATSNTCEMLADKLQKQYDCYSEQVQAQSDKLEKLRALDQTLSTTIDIELALDKLMALANTRSGVGCAMKIIYNENILATKILHSVG